MDFQVDMELLRRIGLARQTVESVVDGSASVDELKETLAVIRGRMSEDLGFLQTLFQSLEEGTESTDQELLSRTTGAAGAPGGPGLAGHPPPGARGGGGAPGRRRRR